VTRVDQDPVVELRDDALERHFGVVVQVQSDQPSSPEQAACALDGPCSPQPLGSSHDRTAAHPRLLCFCEVVHLLPLLSSRHHTLVLLPICHER
jgi:hypothetical protein